MISKQLAKLALAVFLAPIACSSKPTPPPEDPLKSLFPPGDPPKPLTEVDEPGAVGVCNRWRDKTHAKLVKSIPGATEQFGPGLLGGGQCFFDNDKKGLWVVGLIRLDSEKDADGKLQLRGQWQIVRYDEKNDEKTGKEILHAPSQGDSLWATPTEDNFFAGKKELWIVTDVSDFNGDGQKELTTQFRTIEDGKQGPAHGRVLEAKNGEVVEVENTKHIRIDHFDDRNEDGRLDLVTLPFVTPDPCGSNNLFDNAVEFVAITKPDGTFTFTDPNSIKRAKTTCPENPATFAAENPKDPFFTTTLLKNIACAKTWGASEAEVISKIDAALATPNANLKDCPVGKEELTRWAKINPPRTLP